MKIASIIARIVLGLLFVAAGVMGILMLNSPPPMPGLAGEFQRVFFESRWSLFLDAAQILAGALLLVNRLVNLALVILAAFFYNSLAFHITMMPAGLPMAFVAIVLWLLVALPRRANFEFLLK
jgi:putative oxidoreductase